MRNPDTKRTFSKQLRPNKIVWQRASVPLYTGLHTATHLHSIVSFCVGLAIPCLLYAMWTRANNLNMFPSGHACVYLVCTVGCWTIRQPCGLDWWLPVSAMQLQSNTFRRGIFKEYIGFVFLIMCCLPFWNCLTQNILVKRLSKSTRSSMFLIVWYVPFGNFLTHIRRNADTNEFFAHSGFACRVEICWHPSQSRCSSTTI